jgi:hypothetical protein
MLRGPDDGGIDLEPFKISILRQGHEDPLDNTVLNPAVIAALDRLVRA